METEDGWEAQRSRLASLVLRNPGGLWEGSCRDTGESYRETGEPCRETGERSSRERGADRSGSRIRVSQHQGTAGMAMGPPGRPPTCAQVGTLTRST